MTGQSKGGTLSYNHFSFFLNRGHLVAAMLNMWILIALYMWCDQHESAPSHRCLLLLQKINSNIYILFCLFRDSSASAPVSTDKCRKRAPYPAADKNGRYFLEGNNPLLYQILHCGTYWYTMPEDWLCVTGLQHPVWSLYSVTSKSPSHPSFRQASKA